MDLFMYSCLCSYIKTFNQSITHASIHSLHSSINFIHAVIHYPTSICGFIPLLVYILAYLLMYLLIYRLSPLIFAYHPTVQPPTLQAIYV